MDNRTKQLNDVRTELLQILSTGARIDSVDWRRRYPHLQPELDKLLDELLSGETVLEPGVSVGTGAAPTVFQSDPDATGVHDPAADLRGSRSDSDATLPFEGQTPAASNEATSAWSHSERQTNPNAEATVDINATRDESPIAGKLPRESVRAAASQSGARGKSTQPGQRVRYIGDYEIVEVLGQGGMGVVYHACQVSLNRPVALKMIKNAEFANDDQLRRFQNEAEAVATLDHPGIVPIYEIGSYEDQRYFSMKLVQGQSMEKALDALSHAPHEAARIVAEIADAIHHAHQRGILHRDLKPANILLDEHQHAHVTDFGLAKLIDKDEGLTISGAIMGTPGYMSPEQATGRPGTITTASDIYGIGAILFATLTKRAPFVGDSVMVTLDHVRSSPPDSPRKLNVEVPRDLEVICLKCLEKDPRRRYASAQELAADLHRWLAGEPITARPVGPLVRLAMWARRKPALAGLSAASILATLLGIAGITWQWRESVYQRNRAELARSEAIEQKGEAIHQRDLAETARAEALVSEKAAVEARTQAEQNAITAGQQAALALGAIQEMITQVNSGLDAPGLFPVKKAIVESALQRVDQVANILDQSTSKEGTTLAALIELGKIYRQTGKVNQASLIFKRCLDLAHERIKIKNNNSSSRFNLAKVHRELAYCDEELNRNMDAVVANLQDAIRLNEDILAHPTDENPTLNAAFISSVLSDLHTHLGTTYHHLGDIPKAFDEFSRAYSQRKDLLASVKNDAGQAINSNGLVRGAALSALALADCSSRLGRREAAEQYFDQAEALYQQAAQAEPGAVANQIDAGNFHAAKGNYRFRHDEWDQARDHFQKSRAQFTELATADPLNAAHRRELYAATQRLAQLADVQNQPELARKEFEEATRLAEELWRIDESNDLRKIELMMLLPHVGQTDRALTYADAFVAGEQGDMPRPIDPEQWTYLAQTYAQAARALPPEQAERALALQNQAVDAIRKAIERGFKDRTVLDHEHDLDPLRSRADFNALLESVPEPR